MKIPKKKTCKELGNEIEYQMLWHDSDDPQGCCGLQTAGFCEERMSSQDTGDKSLYKTF